MVVMSGEAFISTFLHTINEDTYVLATVYGREGERVHNLHTISRGDGAESAMRSLSSAIVEFVTTVEKQRGDYHSDVTCNTVVRVTAVAVQPH